MRKAFLNFLDQEACRGSHSLFNAFGAEIWCLSAFLMFLYMIQCCQSCHVITVCFSMMYNIYSMIYNISSY